MIYYILLLIEVFSSYYLLNHFKINEKLKKYILVYLSMALFLFIAIFLTITVNEEESIRLLLEHSADKTFLKDYMENYGIGYLVFIQTLGKFSLLNLVITVPASLFILFSYSTFIVEKVKRPLIFLVPMIILYFCIRYFFKDYNQLAIFMAIGILLTSIDTILEKRFFTFSILCVLSYTFYGPTIWFILVFFVYWLSRIKLKTAPKIDSIEYKKNI